MHCNRLSVLVCYISRHFTLCLCGSLFETFLELRNTVEVLVVVALFYFI